MGVRRLWEAKKILKPLVSCSEKHRLALPSAKGGEHSRVPMLNRLENCDHCQAHGDKFSEIILFCGIIGLSCFTLCFETIDLTSVCSVICK